MKDFSLITHPILSCEGVEPYLVQKSGAPRNALKQQPEGSVVLATLMVRTGPRAGRVILLGGMKDQQEHVYLLILVYPLGQRHGSANTTSNHRIRRMRRTCSKTAAFKAAQRTRFQNPKRFRSRKWEESSLLTIVLNVAAFEF